MRLALVAGQARSIQSTVAAAEPLDPDGFYLNLMWHQHQPLYPKDEAGVVTRPWVRVHATKDYYDMAALVGEFPGVKVSNQWRFVRAIVDDWLSARMRSRSCFTSTASWRRIFASAICSASYCSSDRHLKASRKNSSVNMSYLF